ncbi:flagellar filament capping protein FliD [Lysobacter xanthus]
MATSSIGAGSSIDVNTLVTQLVAAERAPTDQRIARVETTTKAQISAFGALRSALSGLQGALKRFDGDGGALGRKVTVGADAGFTATASTEARMGSYQVSVERLATAHRLQSAPVATNTQLGYGRLSIAVGAGTPVAVDIADGKGSLADVRDAINQAMGGKGVTATLVRGDAGDVLSLSSTTVGSAGAISIAASGGDGGLGVLATSGGTLTTVAPPTDAQIIVDGVTRTASGNTLAGVIDGITLNLSKAVPGQKFSLDIASDASPLKATLLGFVSAYNTAMTQMRTQSASGGEGKAPGALSGDAAPRTMMQSLRGTVAGSYASLSALGLKTAVDGSLSLDGATFDKAIAADPEAVTRLLGDKATLGVALRGSLDGFVGPKGIVESRSNSLNDRIKSIGRDKERLDTRMSGIEASYRRQFTQLDALMSKMQSTSNYLSQQLSALASSSN